jgi:HSP20 family molecular chaperone IbpA
MIKANYTKGILTLKVAIPEETQPVEPEKIKVEIGA